MELINNRYRVIKKLKATPLISTYLVMDIFNEYSSVCLNILNPENLSKEVLKYLIDNFYYLTQIDSDKIIKIYNFGLITNIDGKQLKNSSYFYTEEGYEDEYSINQFIENFSDDDKLECFTSICKGIEFLKLKKYNFEKLDLDSLYVYKQNNKVKVKLKNPVDLKVMEYDYWAGYKIQLSIDEDNDIDHSNLKYMGNILVGLYSNYCNSNNTDIILEALNNYNSINEYKNNFVHNVYYIAEKLLNCSYGNFIEVINDINRVFNRRYKKVSINEYKKIHCITRLVGREKDIAKIKESIHNNNGKMFLIHGENGIGKTRLLREIRYWFNINKNNVYFSFCLDEFSRNTKKALLEILKQAISKCEDSVIKEYESELVKFLPQMAFKKEIVQSDSLFGDKEKYRLLDRITSFIIKSLDDKPAVFIIDNIHYADEFTIELIEYLFRMTNSKRNVLFVLSFTDKESITNDALNNFLDKYNNEQNVNEIKLQGLKYNNIETMIKNILRLETVDKELIKLIKEKTYGNPLFIVEIIKDLISKNLLYMDEKTFQWKIRDERYHEITIPYSIETLLFNEINDIEQNYYQILEFISLFNGYISIDILNSFPENNHKDINKSINNLVEKGILIKNIEDGEYNIDFSNKILKRLVYNRMNIQKKIELHMIISQVFEQSLDNINKYEELIYHLEKSHNYDDFIKYCLIYSKKMQELKNIKAAIKYLEKIVENEHNIKKDKLRLFIYKKLGEIHNLDGNFESSVKYYKIGEDIAKGINDYKEQVDILNNLSKIYYKKNKLSESLKIIDDIDLLLMNIDYIEGYLISRHNLSDILVRKRQYNKAKNICEECIKLCEDEYLKEKGSFYNTLGSAYLNLGEVKYSKEAFQKGLACFEKIKSDKGIIGVLNNLGVIYGDYEQNEELSISCFKEMEQISRINNMVELQIVALTNLAETYFYILQYEQALYYFKEALRISKKIDYESLTFYCYFYICNVYLKLNDYDKAYDYFMLSGEELSNYPVQGKEVAEHYRVSAEMYFTFGDLDKAKEVIQKALDIYKDYDFSLRWNSEIVYQYIKLYKTDSNNDTQNVLNTIHDIINKFTTDDSKKEIIYRTAVILYRKKLTKFLKEFIDKYKEILNDVENTQFKLKNLFLNICIDESLSLQHINDAISFSKQSKESEVQWMIYEKLGDHYLNQENYYYAFNYYFEACEIIKELTLKVPLKHQISYFNINGLYSPFSKIERIYKNHEGASKDLISIKKDYEINTIKTLHNQLNSNGFQNILNNKDFIDSVKKLNSMHLPQDVKNIKDIVYKLKVNPIENLEMIIQYLCSTTLASRGFVIIDNKDDELKIIASNSNYSNKDYDLNIVNKVKKTRKALILNDNNVCQSKKIKAVICIPLTLDYNNSNKYSSNDKRNNQYDNRKIEGYLYLDTDRILNNFNNSSFELCNKLNMFISMFLEKIKLYKMSSIDELTGTYTRKYLEEALASMIDQNSITNEEFSILMFDIDNFKAVNDKFGHQTGDKVLEEICKIVMDNVRKNDIVGRYGGEEFIIILPNIGKDKVLKVGEKIRDKIEKAKILGDKRAITVSIGASTYPIHAQWKDELIEKADQALYIAKENGKNRCQLWSNKYDTKNKYTNKLLGIISGKTVQDTRNVLAMVELINLTREELELQDKVYILLGRIIEITEASKGVIFIVDDNKIKAEYGRIAFEDECYSSIKYNDKILDTVMQTKQGTYMVDWDDITEHDPITGVPNWNSIIVVPLVKDGQVKGIIYLKSPVRIKEFKFENFNFVNTLGEIVAGII